MCSKKKFWEAANRRREEENNEFRVARFRTRSTLLKHFLWTVCSRHCQDQRTRLVSASQLSALEDPAEVLAGVGAVLLLVAVAACGSGVAEVAVIVEVAVAGVAATVEAVFVGRRMAGAAVAVENVAGFLVVLPVMEHCLVDYRGTAGSAVAVAVVVVVVVTDVEGVAAEGNVGKAATSEDRGGGGGGGNEV